MMSAGRRTTWIMLAANLGLFATKHTVSGQVSSCGLDPQEELLDHLLNPLTVSCTDGSYAGNDAACSANP
jgi:hypothetical protein